MTIYLIFSQNVPLPLGKTVKGLEMAAWNCFMIKFDLGLSLK